MTALTPDEDELVAEGLALLKPVVDDLLSKAREAVAEHGGGAEPWFAWDVNDSSYSRETLAILLAHFAIREARRAVSDAG